MPKKKYPCIARVTIGVKLMHDFENVEFPTTAVVVLYRLKTSGRWMYTGFFNHDGKRYEVAVDRVTILEYHPSEDRVNAVNANNNPKHVKVPA